LIETRRFTRSKWVVAVLAIWSLWLTAEYWVFGPNSYVRLHNVADQSLPQLIAIRHNIAQGLFGRWATQWASGADRAALPFSADFDVLPFLMLPGWLAYAAVTFCQRFVAGVFTFLLLRNRFTISGWIAVYAAFSYSLFYQPALNHGWTGFALYDYLAIPGIPFFLWLLSGIQNPPRWQSFGIAVLTGVCAAFSGSIHISLFIAPLIVYWFVFVAPRREPIFLANILVFGMTWCALTIWLDGHQMVIAHDSTRSVYVLETIWGRLPGGIWGLLAFVKEFIVSLSADFIPLTLLIIGLALSRFKQPRLLALTVAIIFCNTMQVSYETIAVSLRSKMPFLSAFNFSRFSLLLPFLIIIAASLALNEFTKNWHVNLKRNTPRYEFVLGSVVSVFLICALIGQSIEVKQQTLDDMLAGHNYKAYYEDFQLQQLANLHPESGLYRAVMLSVGDRVQPDFPSGALWAYGFETADGMLNLQPQRYRDFWEQVIAPVMADDPSLYNWIHDWGCQLNLFMPPSGFVTTGNPGSAVGSMKIKDAKGQKDAQASSLSDIDRYYRLNLLSLAGVRYLISPLPIQSSQFTPVPLQFHAGQLTWPSLSRAQKLWEMLRGRYWGPRLYVYENHDLVPRFFLAENIRILGSSGEVLNAMAASSADQLKSAAFLESKDAEGLPAGNMESGSGRVVLRKYGSDEIELGANVSSPAMLVITNNYNPYWKAWVDGRATTIVPVDHTFQAVLLETGKHTILLKYAAPLL
jgi:hypothetical protein